MPEIALTRVLKVFYRLMTAVHSKRNHEQGDMYSVGQVYDVNNSQLSAPTEPSAAKHERAVSVKLQEASGRNITLVRKQLNSLVNAVCQQV